MRDSQRSKLYRSENCLKSLELKFSSFDETVKYARKVLSSKWFLKNFNLHISPSCTGVKLELGAKHRFRSIALKSRGTIIFSDSQLDQSTVLHEITHLVTDTKQAHGREFARNYIKMIKHFMSKEAAEKLKATFKQNGVKYAMRRHRKRSLTPEQKEVLRERMAKALQARMDKRKQAQKHEEAVA